MPVSGRPTKAALLKITQGSSVERNGFQKMRKAAGDSFPAASADVPLATENRWTAMTATETRSKMESTATAVFHDRRSRPAMETGSAEECSDLFTGEGSERCSVRA